MRFYDIIAKKRHGYALSGEEIDFFVNEYTCGNIPDYQASALLMAICTMGMNPEETARLTAAIAASGDNVDLSRFGTLTADKHSTGGVGDKTTLIVAPLAAALGCKVAKMSGRALGHTGGTVDKLESFPGYDVSLSPEKFLDTVERIGISVVGQSGNLAPADKKIYALRDVTATVDSIPLIASSIMGKKLAAGAHSIVLDVKFGSGSFMKTPENARALAEAMVDIGRKNGRSVSALVTNMDSPLGYAIGNTLEVKEAIATLRGEGPRDLTEICIALASEMARSALGITIDEAKEKAAEALASGAAYNKFKEWIAAQGGDVSYVDDPEKFDTSPYHIDLLAQKSGYITSMDTERIGLASSALGAGRSSKDAQIDYTAGIVFAKKTGDTVAEGDLIATLYSSKKETLESALSELSSAISIGSDEPNRLPLIIDRIS